VAGTGFGSCPANATVASQRRRGGRLEIDYLAEWGTICDDNWGDMMAASNQRSGELNAEVACRGLGYPRGTFGTSSLVADGTGQIWKDDVLCNGNEDQLEDCDSRTWGANNCSHSEDVGVLCFGTWSSDNATDCSLRVCDAAGCSVPQCTSPDDGESGVILGIFLAVLAFFW